MLYHISKTAGLKKLKPQVSTHKKPYVYAIENVVTGLLFGGPMMILTLLSAKKMVSPLLWNAIPVPSGCYSKIKSVRSMRSTMRDLCEE